MIIGLKLQVKKITEKEPVSFTSLFRKSKVKHTHHFPPLANASVRLCLILSYLPLLVSLLINLGLLRARYIYRLTVESLGPFLSVCERQGHWALQEEPRTPDHSSLTLRIYLLVLSHPFVLLAALDLLFLDLPLVLYEKSTQDSAFSVLLSQFPPSLCSLSFKYLLMSPIHCCLSFYSLLEFILLFYHFSRVYRRSRPRQVCIYSTTFNQDSYNLFA